MHRSASDLIKTAEKLLADYGKSAEEEAHERAVLLGAIGRHEEARDWLTIADHVAAIGTGRAFSTAA